MKNIIKDWAGNILNYKGVFERPELAVAMEFDTIDDAYEYAETNFPDDTLEDIYFDEKE